MSGQKLKMLRIRFCFDRKMRPGEESQCEPPFAKNMWREIQKVGIPSFSSSIVSSSQGISETMLVF